MHKKITQYLTKGAKTMDITKLKFDPNCLGGNLIAVNVKPVFQYENGHRVSDEVICLRYDTVCPDVGFEKIGIRVDVKARKLEVSEENPVEVEFDGLEMSPVWTPNGYIVRATAKGIKAVGKTE